MSRRAERYAWLIIMGLLACVATARAEPEVALPPWEHDVSAADKRKAELLFGQAVEVHEQLLRDQAVALYEEALSHWENPHIRWNLALLTKDMGQYVRAYEHLERALAWGPDAFDQHDREKLIGMKQMLLRQHLAVVDVSCAQPDAEITLDGKPWFRGPGSARQVVLQGEHVIMASKPGYFPVTRNIAMLAGTRGAVNMVMSMSGIFERRPWKPWKQWAVIGSGLAVGVAGIGLEWHARGQFEAARRELGSQCGGAQACDPATPSRYRRALSEHRIATGIMVAGGVAAVAGVAVALLNQPRSRGAQDRGRSTFELVPLATPGTAGASATFRF